VGFPGAFVLHGPPGCGKTYAVERLVEYLDWPCFSIEASTVASPYIHETSRKVAEVFDKAMSQAPSVVVIDEMEAFVAHRDGEQGHRIEEVAEFLRRIPEAAKNDVLVVAMTNMIDAIDPAILRRGRFDHAVAVGWPSEAEVKAALGCMLAEIPKEPDVDTALLAAQLRGRPLSDVAYVAREGARLAARSNKERLDQASLQAAVDATPDRTEETTTRRRIGLV
jgi:SpoVK/Ycf46/Vps4 family AAA+-type ATPase